MESPWNDFRPVVGSLHRKSSKTTVFLMVFYGKPSKPLYFDTFCRRNQQVTAGDGICLGFLNISEISIAFRSKSIKNHWLQRWLRQCENPWCETGDRRCLTYQWIYAILTDLTNDLFACLPWNWLFVQQGPKCVLPPHSGLTSSEA